MAAAPPMLRPYQAAAVRAVLDALRSHRSAVLTMATGCGKTICMAELVRLGFARGRRVLLLAHREELLGQAADKFRTAAPGLRVGIERAESRVDVANLPDVVVASVQTLSRPARLARFAPDAVALVLIDEAHHAPAEGYRRVLEHFAIAKVVGVTATPDRLDGAALGEVFDCAPFTYGIRDAIGDGWLVPIRQRRVVVEALDLSRVRTTAGDLNGADLERELMRDQVLHEVAAPLVELASDRPTIVFAAAVSQAHALAEVITAYGGSAAALDGSTPDSARAELLQRFAAGDVQYLVNVGILTEGFDCPAASCVAMARPTKSRGLYTQCVGRGTRPVAGLVDGIVTAEARRVAIAGSSKPHVLVLDFTTANAGRHTLVSPLDVLAGKPIDEALRKRAERIASDGADRDVAELLGQAAAELEEEQRRAARRGVRAHARYRTQDVDPFAHAFELLGADLTATPRIGTPATPKQIAVLQQGGFELDWANLDKAHASALIERIADRWRRGLCSTKQAAQLARRGLKSDVSFEDAREALDAIARNNWRAPAWLYADPRFTPGGKGAAA